MIELNAKNELTIYCLDGSKLTNVNTFKYLGVWLDNELSFSAHIDSVTKKVNCILGQLYRSANCFTLPVRKRIITQLVLPIIDYADIVYQNTSHTNLSPLYVTFNSLCRFTLLCPYRTHHCTLYESLNWLPPNTRMQSHWLQFILKCIFLTCPPYLKQYFVPHSSSYSLRQLQYPSFTVPRTFRVIGRRAFQFKAPSDWNNLPNSLRSISSLHSFKIELFNHLKTQCSCF